MKETFGDKILDGNFIDLGSGIGRGVIAAAFLRPFHKCIGIEYLEKLHLIALEIKLNYDSKFEEVSKLYQEYFPSYVSLPEVEIINGDFLNKSWENASILLANSTCFSPELMLSLSLKAELELKVGAIFITFTKRLPNLPADRWELKDGFRRMMSWGIATVYIHRKIK